MITVLVIKKKLRDNETYNRAHMLFRALVRLVSTAKYIASKELSDETCLWVCDDDLLFFYIKKQFNWKYVYIYDKYSYL